MLFSNGKASIELNRIDIKLKELPDGFDGLKILHISDLHLKGESNLTRLIKDALDFIYTDLAIVTGDFMDSWAGKTACSSILSHLNTRYGIYGVFGNHDHRLDVGLLLKALQGLGVKMLINNSDVIRIKNIPVQMIGVDSGVYDDPFMKSKEDLNLAMTKVTKDDFKILLSHSPDIIENASEAKINVVFAGHTHGGQIRLPIIGPIYTSSKYGSKYASGLYEQDGTFMYVNRGIGCSKDSLFPFPVRINCPPEIAIIRLLSAK